MTTGRNSICGCGLSLVVVAIIVAATFRVTVAIIVVIVVGYLVRPLRGNLLAKLLHGHIGICGSNASIQVARILLIIFGPWGVHAHLRLGKDVGVTAARRL